VKVIAHKDETMEADVFSDGDIILFRKLVGFEGLTKTEESFETHMKRISIPIPINVKKAPKQVEVLKIQVPEEPELPIVDLSRLPKTFMTKHLYAQIYGKAGKDISTGHPVKYHIVLKLLDKLIAGKQIKRVGKKSKHYMNLSFGNSEISELVESVERPMMEVPERQTAKVAQPSGLPEYPPRKYISGVLHNYDVKNAVIGIPDSFNMREIFKEVYGYDFNAVRADEETIKKYMKLFTILRNMVKKEGSLTSKKQFVDGRWIAYFYKNDNYLKQASPEEEEVPKELGFDYTDFPVILPNLIKDVLETNDAITANTFSGLQSKNGNIIDWHSSNFLFDWICSHLSLVNKLTGKTFLYGGSGASKFLKVEV